MQIICVCVFFPDTATYATPGTFSNYEFPSPKYGNFDIDNQPVSQ